MLQPWEPEIDGSLLSTPCAAITPLKNLISPNVCETKETTDLLLYYKPDDSSANKLQTTETFNRTINSKCNQSIKFTSSFE